jgi:hypothetical protein
MRQSYARKVWFSRFDASVLHRRAGRYEFDSYLDFLFDHRGIYGNIVCQYTGWYGAEDLAGFFGRNVFHCGVLDRSSDFSRGLSEKLGRPFVLPTENRTAGERPAITMRQRSILEQIYSRDLTLYEWVRAHT